MSKTRNDRIEREAVRFEREAAHLAELAAISLREVQKDPSVMNRKALNRARRRCNEAKRMASFLRELQRLRLKDRAARKARA